MPTPNLCAVTGNVKSLLGQNVQNCTIQVSVLTPFFHSGSFISGEIASVLTDSDGDFSISVIETETVGQRVNFTFEYYDGTSSNKRKSYSVVVPDDATVALADLIAASIFPITVTTLPASSVTVSAITNLSATNVQTALAELQADIDTTNTLADGKIYVGNASNVATEVTPTGDVTISNAGVTAIGTGVIVNADVSASAAIAGTKIAPDFGSQNVVTTGTLGAGLTTVSNVIVSGTTADTVPYLNSSKQLESSGVTPTELGRLSGVSSNVQTQINTKAPIASPTFTGTVTAPTVNVSGLTASRAVVTDGSKNLSSSTVTSTEVGYLSGVTSAIQTQIDAKVAGQASSVDSEIALFSGTGGKTIKRATGTGIAHVTSGVLSVSNIVNADVDAAAAIAGTKISPNFGSQAVSSTGTGSFGTTSTVTGAGTQAVVISNSTAGTSGSPQFTRVNFLGFSAESRARIEAIDQASSGNGSNLRLSVANTSNTLTEFMRIGSSGEIYFQGLGTTGSAANAFIDSGSSPANQLLRSTSSLRYKTNIVDSNIDSSIIYKLRPVEYDDRGSGKHYFGLIAEEVAKLAPILVHYAPEKALVPGGSDKLVPDGVQYDRLAVLLIQEIKELKKEINKLKKEKA